MKKVLRIFGFLLAGIVLLIIVAAVTIPYMYKDEIMQVVTEKVGKQIKADITLSKVDLSLWGNIPNISIQLHNVCLKSTDTFNKKEFPEPTDTALYAQRVLLSFNMLDFLFENYVVQEIVVRDANVNYFMDSKKRHNWDVSIESDSTGEDMFVDLSEIRFVNTLAVYHDKTLDVKLSEWFDKIKFSGKFRGDEFFVDAYAAFTNKECNYKAKSYFPKSSFKCDVSLIRDSSMYVIQKMKLETPVGLLLSDGTVNLLKNNEYLVNLNINIESTVSKILNVLPKKVTDTLAPYKLQSDIFVEGVLDGKITKKTMPKLVCNVACTKGSVLFEKTKYAFSTRGTFKAKDVSKLNTFEYSSPATTIHTGNSDLTLQSLQITNLDNPTFSFDGNVNLNIDDIEQLMKIEDYSFSGNFVGSLKGAGKLNDVTEINKDFFKKTKFEADLRCKDVKISAPEDSPYDFDNVSGKLSFTNGTISIDSVQGNVQRQPFTMQGKASDFVQYILFDDVNSHCNLNCSCESINLTPFYEHYEKYLASSESTGSLLGSIRFEAKRLDYEPYHLTNAATIITLAKDYIELSEINASTLQGKFVGGKVRLTDLPNGQTRCTAEGSISKMSAREIFTTFDNFDQTVITDKQIDGSLSGIFKFTAIFDEEYNPLYPTIDALADVIIEDGSVNNVETLVEIGKKMKMVEEFTNVSFSTLKNTLRVKNDTLYIPDMKVMTNAFEMSFAGTHNIENNQFYYYVTLFLKKTLSTKFHNKNKDTEDFGEIEKNSDGNVKVPIKIHGDPDKYDIDYDFKKSKENVKKGLENQKSEWKDIINNNNEGKDDVQEEKPIESNFQIEWD